MKRIPVILAVGVFATAALFSLRSAWSDFEFRRGTEASVASALRVLPNNVQYLLFRALQLEYAGADSTAELERAATLSPMSSAPRIRLGLAAEFRGDLKAAEKWLLEAANVDHQFEPRWTLANFYFRQNRRDEFWTWTRSALEVSYGDRRPVFDLCWRVGQNATEILRRGVPADRGVLGAMLLYALERHKDQAGIIAEELAKIHLPADVPLLDGACGQLIESGDADSAARLWRAAGHAPAGGVWNGSFENFPFVGGFDWRVDAPTGVTHLNLGAQGGHRIELSGQQPESARLFGQTVILDPGRRYRLEWTTRTNGLPAVTGLVWRLGEQRVPLVASLDAPSGAKNDFAVVAVSKRLTPLELWYQRPTGQVRAEGWVEIRKVSLVLVP